MWINPNTLEVLKLHSDIRAAFTNVSFPRDITEEDISSVGLKPVKATAEPEYDITKNVSAGTPVLQNGEWVQVWNVLPRFKDYTDDAGVVHTVADQQAAAVEAARLASVPPSVSMAKARAVLITGGHMASITAALDAMTGIEGEVARSNWEFATTVDRDDPLTQSLATALGLTDLQMDALFIAAGASATTTTQGTT
jgi:hypothetical protein